MEGEGACSPSNSRSLFRRSSKCAGSSEWSTGSTLRRRSPISMKMAQLSTALRGIRFGMAEIQSMISRWTKASHLQIVSAQAHEVCSFGMELFPWPARSCNQDQLLRPALGDSIRRGFLALQLAASI